MPLFKIYLQVSVKKKKKKIQNSHSVDPDISFSNQVITRDIYEIFGTL